MRFLPGCLAAVLLVLLLVPLAGAQAAPPVPPPSCAEGPTRSATPSTARPAPTPSSSRRESRRSMAAAATTRSSPGPIAAVRLLPQRLPARRRQPDLRRRPWRRHRLRRARQRHAASAAKATTSSSAAPATTCCAAAPATTCSSAASAPTAIDGDSGNDYDPRRRDHRPSRDSGPATDVDTLSYSTGVTPGFSNRPGHPDFSRHANFPTAAAERGVYLDLRAPLGPDGFPEENGENGGAPKGGGVDEVERRRLRADRRHSLRRLHHRLEGGAADLRRRRRRRARRRAAPAPARRRRRRRRLRWRCQRLQAASRPRATGPVVPPSRSEVSVGSMTEGEAGYTSSTCSAAAAATGHRRSYRRVRRSGDHSTCAAAAPCQSSSGRLRLHDSEQRPTRSARWRGRSTRCWSRAWAAATTSSAEAHCRRRPR